VLALILSRAHDRGSDDRVLATQTAIGELASIARDGDASARTDKATEASRIDQQGTAVDGGATKRSLDRDGTNEPLGAGRTDGAAVAAGGKGPAKAVRDDASTKVVRHPILAGRYEGAYWYADRARLANKNMAEVGFNLVVRPKAGSGNEFTGECDEQYSDFGTVERGRVRSRIVNGVCRLAGNGVKVTFIKRYNGYPPQPIYYEGTYDPIRKRVTGTWHGEAGLGPGGGFVFTAVPQQGSSKPRP